MPRIRIRTSEGERIVGTSSCSILTVQLVAHRQRQTLQLRADAKMMAGDSVLEHVSWEWPELSDKTRIELISDPDSSPYVAYDPPDGSLSINVEASVSAEQQRSAELDYLAAERELHEAMAALTGISSPSNIKSPGRRSDPHSMYCSFCGKSQHEVRKLVAGPAVFICDECVNLAKDILGD